MAARWAGKLPGRLLDCEKGAFPEKAGAPEDGGDLLQVPGGHITEAAQVGVGREAGHGGEGDTGVQFHLRGQADSSAAGHLAAWGRRRQFQIQTQTEIQVESNLNLTRATELTKIEASGLLAPSYAS